jgi:rubrerythrin
MSNSYDALTSIGGGGGSGSQDEQPFPKKPTAAEVAAGQAERRAERALAIAAHRQAQIERANTRQTDIASNRTEQTQRAQARREQIDNVIAQQEVGMTVRTKNGEVLQLRRETNREEKEHAKLAQEKQRIEAKKREAQLVIMQLEAKKQKLADMIQRDEMEINRLNDRLAQQTQTNTNAKTELASLQALYPPYTNPNLVPISAKRRIAQLNSLITRTDDTISKTTTLKNQVQARKNDLDNKLQVCDFGQRDKLLQVCDLFPREDQVIKELLDKEDKTRKAREKKTIVETEKQNAGKGCICPTVYQPVVIDGVTYGNACEAQCAGKTVPSNPVKPPELPKPPTSVCLQVITCGSDGKTYPDSCLPPGVYPVKRGGSCDGVSIPGDVENPFTRPPVITTADPVINVIKSLPNTQKTLPPVMLACGVDNVTYNVAPGAIPDGMSISVPGVPGVVRNKPTHVKIKNGGSCVGNQYLVLGSKVSGMINR